jgi:hypothetical protein
MSKKKEPAHDPDTGEVFEEEYPVGYVGLDANGHEILDDTPVSLPTRFLRPQNLLAQMRAVVEEMNIRAQENQLETWEEANDFDIGDDFEPSSSWEVDESTEENYYGDQREYHRAKRDGRGKGGRQPTPPGNPDGAQEPQGNVQPSSAANADPGPGRKDT